MSVRAYIKSQEKAIRIDNKIIRLIVEDLNPLFNVWHHTNLFDLIRYAGYDCTNNDSVGCIGCTAEDWEDIKNEDEFTKLTEEEKSIVPEIDKYFKEHYELELNCY